MVAGAQPRPSKMASTITVHGRSDVTETKCLIDRLDVADPHQMPRGCARARPRTRKSSQRPRPGLVALQLAARVVDVRQMETSGCCSLSTPTRPAPRGTCPQRLGRVTRRSPRAWRPRDRPHRCSRLAQRHIAEIARSWPASCPHSKPLEPVPAPPDLRLVQCGQPTSGVGEKRRARRRRPAS